MIGNGYLSFAKQLFADTEDILLESKFVLLFLEESEKDKRK